MQVATSRLLWVLILLVFSWQPMPSTLIDSPIKINMGIFTNIPYVFYFTVYTISKISPIHPGTEKWKEWSSRHLKVNLCVPGCNDTGFMCCWEAKLSLGNSSFVAERSILPAASRFGTQGILLFAGLVHDPQLMIHENFHS